MGPPRGAHDPERPLDACAELCGITHQTAFEWHHRVFATVRGYQDRAPMSANGSCSV